jgi:hypothetical protein
VLVAGSIVTTLIAFLPVVLATIRPGSPYSQIFLFPAMWATAWYVVSYLSPVGRLATWSPVLGLESYNWMAKYTGPVGYDWVVAAWAVVCSQTVKMLLHRTDTEDENSTLIDHELPDEEVTRAPPLARKVLILVTILAALTLPSFVLNNLPLPPSTSDTTTALTVGCVLPPSSRQHTLDDFITESKKLTKAKILLWPEGAVRFDSSEARDAGLERVRKEVRGPYVGVAFEEFVSDEASGRAGRRRTGVALVSSNSHQTHMTYYKRHLVPIAESFSLSQSAEPPTIYTLELPPPSGIPKSEWASAPNYTRPIPLTASICLDFSSLSPFSELNSRPALILAPARTWHKAIGFAMWEQAKARAEEIGSMVLWCDGGEGGVSGIAGRRANEVTQVGQGSWVRTMAVEWPFDEGRSTYAKLGDLSMILLFWTLWAGGCISQLTAPLNIDIRYPRLEAGVQRLGEKAGEAWRRWRGRGGPGEEQPSLI